MRPDLLSQALTCGVQAGDAGLLPVEAALCMSEEEGSVSGHSVLNTTLHLAAEVARACRGHGPVPIGMVDVHASGHTC